MSAPDDEERRRQAAALSEQLRSEIIPAAEMILATVETTEGVSFGRPGSDARMALATGIEVGMAATLVVLQRRDALDLPGKP